MHVQAAYIMNSFCVYPVKYNSLSLESKNKQIQMISSLFQILQ